MPDKNVPDSAARGQLPKLTASLEQEKLHETHAGLTSMLNRRKRGEQAPAKSERKIADKRGMSLREFAESVRDDEDEEMEAPRPHVPQPQRKPDTLSKAPLSGAALVGRLLGGKR